MVAYCRLIVEGVAVAALEQTTGGVELEEAKGEEMNEELAGGLQMKHKGTATKAVVDLEVMAKEQVKLCEVPET